MPQYRRPPREDEPGWNPRTMGNRRSGQPPAGPAGPIGKPKSHKDLIRAWLASHDRPSNSLRGGSASDFFGTSGGPRDYSPGFKWRTKANAGRRYHS